MPLEEPIVAVEIGTTKVVGMVGEVDEEGQLTVTGVVQNRSAGVRKSEIVDLEAASGSVKSVLEQLEKQCDMAVHAAYVSISGGHIRSKEHKGVTTVSDPGGTVSEDDVETVRELARSAPLPEDREALHTIFREYCIDDHYRVLQPLGMEGRSLSVDVMTVHGLKGRLHNSAHAVEASNVNVLGLNFGGLCSALAVLSPQQKKMGSVVIDLGGGTTDYLAYAGGVVAAAGSLGVGGDHVTNDISAAFGLPRVRAEQVKLLMAAAHPDDGAHRSSKLPADGGFAEVALDVSSLNEVVHARVEETFQLVRRRLDEAGLTPRLGAGVILTGGGSQLSGVVDVARNVFHVPCRAMAPEPLFACDGVEPHQYPGLSSCYGALLLGQRSGGGEGGGPTSVFGALMNLLRVR
jgi:cell division protein FtsA